MTIPSYWQLAERTLPTRLLTIYDLRVEMKWSGVTADGGNTDGTITLPEVSHEVGADGDHDYPART